MVAGKSRTQCMPSSARMSSSKIETAMCGATAAFAGILLIETGVVTSVSLFVRVLGLSLVLLASLVVLIGLVLSGLTGRIVLVGLAEGLAPGMTKGD